MSKAIDRRNSMRLFLRTLKRMGLMYDMGYYFFGDERHNMNAMCVTIWFKEDGRIKWVSNDIDLDKLGGRND